MVTRKKLERAPLVGDVHRPAVGRMSPEVEQGACQDPNSVAERLRGLTVKQLWKIMRTSGVECGSDCVEKHHMVTALVAQLGEDANAHSIIDDAIS